MTGQAGYGQAGYGQEGYGQEGYGQEGYDGGYDALAHGLGTFDFHRDVVRVSGPDAEKYLQGQLSQDVAALAPGAWAWALVLAPQGKLDAFVRVRRPGPDEFVLDTDAGMGPALVARLLRFRLRTKADVEQLEWRTVAVRGPGTASLSFPAPPGGDVVAVPFQWGGLSGYDLFGAEPMAPPGAVAVSAPAYEAARIEAGFPRHGAELDERTVPAEAGLVEASVSFTKGCYTGQELVARIDSRGSNVPRNLRGLRLSGPAAPGERLYRSSSPGEGGAGEAKEVGRLTSVARSPQRGWVALGYVARAVAVGESLMVAGGPDPAPAGGPGPAREGAPGPVQAEVNLLPLSSDGR